MYPAEDAILTDFPPDKEISYVEHITRLLNFWRSKLIKRTAEYHEAMERRAKYPDSVISVVSGRGETRQMTITQIVENRVAPIREARSYVESLERMLTLARDGELSGEWSDERVLFPAETVTGELQ